MSDGKLREALGAHRSWVVVAAGSRPQVFWEIEERDKPALVEELRRMVRELGGVEVPPRSELEDLGAMLLLAGRDLDSGS